MQQFGFDIIGTHLDIRIDTDTDFSILFTQIESRLRYFEAKYSRFISGNWLDVLNQKRTATLDIDGQNMLAYMLEVARHTDGYFDPTVGKRLTELGYWNSRFRIQDSKWESGYGNYRDIEIIWDQVILHWDILLEFWGVGKGYLIDVICGIIGSWGHRASNGSGQWHYDTRHYLLRYLINFGGDMYGRGGWTVGLESPFATDEVIGTYILDDGFLACSAWTRRKWAWHHHLINPHTGESAREVVASYIEWSSGISVDSYATALCVMPWEHAVDTLRKTPEISGVIVRHDGTLFQKAGSNMEVFG
jgi:FAD:protein FMN transferase